MSSEKLSRILRVTLLIMGVFGIIFLVFGVPRLELVNGQNHINLYARLFLALTSLPFFLAIILAWNICNAINIGESFSEKNVSRLSYISYMGILESILYVFAIIIVILNIGYQNIFLVLSLLFLFFGIMVAIFTSLLARLVEKARQIEEENEYTI